MNALQPFTQRNFVADFLQAKCDFRRKSAILRLRAENLCQLAVIMPQMSETLLTHTSRNVTVEKYKKSRAENLTCELSVGPQKSAVLEDACLALVQCLGKQRRVLILTGGGLIEATYNDHLRLIG